MKHQVEITLFIENYRKTGMFIKFCLPSIFVQGGAKIKWSEPTVQERRKLDGRKLNGAKI